MQLSAESHFVGMYVFVVWEILFDALVRCMVHSLSGSGRNSCRMDLQSGFGSNLVSFERVFKEKFI